MTKRSWTASSLLLALFVYSAPARSGDADRPAALAEGLFEKGRQLMQEGKYEQACPALLESYRLDSAGGTVLNLAVCYERAGKLASAYVQFQEALRVAKRDNREDREKIATDRMAALQARRSTLEVRVGESERPSDFQVLLNGLTVPSAGWGVAVPIDGGRHRVRASAPGRTSFSTMVTVGTERDHVVVSVPPLEDGAASSPPPPVAQTRPSPVREEAERCVTGFEWDGHGCAPAPTETQLKSSFWVWAGLSGTFVLAGAVTGALALSENGTAIDEARARDFEASDASNDASLVFAWVSTGSFVMAGTFALVGLTSSWQSVPVTESSSVRVWLAGNQIGAQLRL